MALFLWSSLSASSLCFSSSSLFCSASYYSFVGVALILKFKGRIILSKGIFSIFSSCFFCLALMSPISWMCPCRHVSISPLEVEPSKHFPLLQGLVILGSRRMDILLDIDLVAPSTEEFIFDSLKTLTDLLLAVINSENLFNRRSWNYCKAL